ncbi:RNA exonuclease 4 [Plakobranchus ocellatus]|uniref:RNA exonuclease 4 n=1 Tax=Plakobranchus ocellatus TaxID=259542 RepID=A0AAV4CBR2_9GAST|nr:RNA exonuclease 4 [Plakobranchus ocellatus]
MSSNQNFKKIVATGATVKNNGTQLDNRLVREIGISQFTTANSLPKKHPSAEKAPSGAKNTSKSQSASSQVFPAESSSQKSHQIQASRLGSHTTQVMDTGGATSTDFPGKRKRRKGSKKVHDGISNWANLCSKLKIDPTRKNKNISKFQVENKDESPNPPVRQETKPEIWFDNVDKILIEGELTADSSSASTSKDLVKPDSYRGVTHCVAMDCEMVGVGQGGEESILARVSIVNHYGVCLYDKFVLPRERVTDYRTHVSGVTKENLSTGEEFTKVQQEVSEIIKGKILVGHALHNDLKVLFLTHPHKMIRDTSKYKPFRQLLKGGIPSLKKLADKVLGVSVQEGQHSSVQDAQAAMRLYTMHRQRWEKDLRQLWKQDKKKMKKKTKKKQGKQAQS